MAPLRKSERLLNLLIMLLVQRRYVSKDRIREILYPGQGTDAFEKMFERDKEELRSLGVPIEVGSLDVFFDDEPGYRIRPDEFALPEISLEADEASVIGLAAKVWEHARLAEVTTDAVRKLTAAGVPVDVSALELVQPRLARARAGVRRLLGGDAHPHAGGLRLPPRRASRSRRATSSPGAWCGTPAAGTPSAWTPTAARSGSSGSPASTASRASTARPAPSRCPRAPTSAPWPGGWRRPGRQRPRSSSSGPAPATGCAARRGRCERRRRRAPTPPPAWDRLTVDQGDVADEILTYGADAFVEGPADLRESVVTPAPRGRRGAAWGRRRDRPGRRRRQGAGRPAAHPGALPALARPGPHRRGRPRPRRLGRAAGRATCACSSCAASPGATRTT